MEGSLKQQISQISGGPRTLTIITTYQCTAACNDCCFESSPEVKGRLTLKQITDFIDESFSSFDDLEVVVFSGGEPLLLGNDLFDAIAHATGLGLKTRVVSNGYWGKSRTLAQRTAESFRESGLTEINLSTGLDHAEYVPLNQLITAIQALVYVGIPNRVTVESDAHETSFHRSILRHPTIVEILQEKPWLLSFQVNSWMPFHDSSERRKLPGQSAVDGACDQLFHNLVLTPYKEVSACCGLTFEHLPSLKLGQLYQAPVKDLYASQFDDFLKIWIKTDGPAKILKTLFPGEVEEEIDQLHHICQACALMQQSEVVMEKLLHVYPQYIEGVLARYIAKESVKRSTEKFEAKEAS